MAVVPMTEPRLIERCSIAVVDVRVKVSMDRVVVAPRWQDRLNQMVSGMVVHRSDPAMPRIVVDAGAMNSTPKSIRVVKTTVILMGRSIVIIRAAVARWRPVIPVVRHDGSSNSHQRHRDPESLHRIILPLFETVLPQIAVIFVIAKVVPISLNQVAG